MSADDPLGGIARRKLHVVLLLDTSKSMTGPRIESLNQAVRTVLWALAEAAKRNPHADVYVRQLEFSSGARWRSPEWLAMKEYGEGWDFKELSADGTTDFGAALDKLTEEFDPAKLGPFNFAPVLVLISDGLPTDDWQSALKRFNASPFGRSGRTIRAAVNVAGEADAAVLNAFTGNRQTVVVANNSSHLVTFLTWATVTLTRHSSMGRSSAASGPGPGMNAAATVPLPPPAPAASPGEPDVF
jgi:uncharacterized protein YegL